MKNEINILGQIYFTEYDETITGTTLRDPLGLQPIWSYYGRQAICHLTTISNDIRGFREVLLCLAICQDCINRGRKDAPQDLILLFEQLFIYSMIEKGKSEGIIGRDNGLKRYRNERENPKISSDDTILKSQISAGYYGRYKMPMNTMGIIGSDGELLDGIDVIKLELYGSNLYNTIQTAFEGFLNSKNRHFQQFSAADELIDAVAGKLRPGEKDFWLEKLQVKGPEKCELMNRLYREVNSYSSAEVFFNKFQDYSEVNDILRLEPFFRCLEYVFYKALLSRNIQEIEIDDRTLKEHMRRYDDFLSVSPTKDISEGILKKRLDFLKEKCSPESGDYIRNIIEYHTIVCDQKKNSVWLEIDANDNIQSFMNIDVNTEEILKTWGRDYYLASLRSIKCGIKELGV